MLCLTSIYLNWTLKPFFFLIWVLKNISKLYAYCLDGQFDAQSASFSPKIIFVNHSFCPKLPGNYKTAPNFQRTMAPNVKLISQFGPCCRNSTTDHVSKSMLLLFQSKIFPTSIQILIFIQFNYFKVGHHSFNSFE